MRSDNGTRSTERELATGSLFEIVKAFAAIRGGTAGQTAAARRAALQPHEPWVCFVNL